MKHLLSEFYSSESAGAIVAHARGLETPQFETYGYADIAKRTLFTSSSVFDIASVTKTFTGAAIALLHQRGELNVKSPLEVYLPSLTSSRKNRFVTLQDLLWHISGIPDYLEHFTQDQYPHLVNSDVVEFTKNHIDSSHPGLERKYCNTNYVLLASIIETVSGQTLNGF